jgi:hypothetical protein
MHLAAGLFGHDAEQQRFGQIRRLVLGPHLEAHVLVVNVGIHQRRAPLRQPHFQRRLDRPVHRDQLGELLSVQQRHAALRLGETRRAGLAGRQRGLGGVDIAVQILIAAEVTVLQPQQTIEYRVEALRIAARRTAAARRRCLELIQRLCQRDLGALNVALARLLQRHFVALAGLVELGVERVDLGAGFAGRRGCGGASSKQGNGSSEKRDTEATEKYRHGKFAGCKAPTIARAALRLNDHGFDKQR